MTTERQRAANRVNAARSCGPKSNAGKRTAARNALKHGLTTPPAPQDVLQWGRILLDQPLARWEDIEAREPELAELAAAEAQLERALAAERKCLGEVVFYLKKDREQDLRKLDFRNFDIPAVLEMFLTDPPEKLDKKLLRILLSISRRKITKLKKQHCTLQRYVTTAERARARAFAAWLATQRRAA